MIVASSWLLLLTIPSMIEMSSEMLGEYSTPPGAGAGAGRCGASLVRAWYGSGAGRQAAALPGVAGACSVGAPARRGRPGMVAAASASRIDRAGATPIRLKAAATREATR